MDSEGLTIFHVKSHLQKYRIVKYIPESQEDSTKPATENRRARETIENNDRTAAKDKRESSEDTKRLNIIVSLRFRPFSSAFFSTRRLIK
ncbi:hypothetical protein F2Q70_00006520 [Brassica cretica]|uniref:HTH myb-type domain-containing protein n=1 Tax=Brassica cretica TaxID=69181 RepID=A0A8S9FP56_BRACR|nr:hypothetical protein F2Q68_00023158 [Brassica cretica]KAF2572058.1 hypothetical protein F2Q70_00006520 [Brassica cretica]